MNRNGLKLALVVLLAFGLYSGSAQAQTCRGNAGLALAKAYGIAIGYPDSLPAFVRRNAQFFQQDGPAIRCGRRLAYQLMHAALSGPSPSSVSEHANDVACRAGMCHMGPTIANDIMKSRADLYQLAGFVQSIADTAPRIVKNDLVPYHQSGIYQTSRFVWQMTGSLAQGGILGPGFIPKYRQMMSSMSEWYLLQYTNAMP